MKRVPDLARKLEQLLYRTASSAEEYSDRSTLKYRLQMIAIGMGARGPNKRSRSDTETENTVASGASKGDGQEQGESQSQIQTEQTQQGGALTVEQQQQPMSTQDHQSVLQQRLLAVRHASKCRRTPGTCLVVPNCPKIKQLWAPMSKREDKQCQVSRCVSSKYVLSHYLECQDARCAACGPVRQQQQRKTQQEWRQEIQFTQQEIQLMQISYFVFSYFIQLIN